MCPGVRVHTLHMLSHIARKVTEKQRTIIELRQRKKKINWVRKKKRTHTTSEKKKKSWNKRNGLKKEKETTHQASKKGLMNDRTGFSFLYSFFIIRFTARFYCFSALIEILRNIFFFLRSLLSCCCWTKTTFGWIFWMWTETIWIFVDNAARAAAVHGFLNIPNEDEIKKKIWCFEFRVCLIDHVFTWVLIIITTFHSRRKHVLSIKLKWSRATLFFCLHREWDL